VSMLCWTGDMRLPARVQEAMQMQVEAERKKRAAILESEGQTHEFQNYLSNIKLIKIEQHLALSFDLFVQLVT